jgi:lipoprotein-anchoring transpeptidase ErfK/SrfK
MVRFLSMNPRRLLVLAAVSGGTALLAGCGSPAGGGVAINGSNQAAVVVAQPPNVQVTPGDHAADVPLDTPVTVSSSGGNITSVSVTRVGGGTVAGLLSANKRTWTTTDGLDPSARYQVAVTAVGAAETHTSTATSFTTLTSVAGRLLSSSTPDDGAVVGVGEPFDLTFNTPIPQSQQANIVNHLSVVSTPAQQGAWHWFSASEIHYRPAQYWTTGTKVTVTADFHGVNAGNGVWGLASWTKSFSVGDKHVSVINNQTHQMAVYSNDNLLYNWPVSLGKAGFPTLSGNLIVLYKTPKVKMSSCPTFGGAACVPGSANFYSDYVYEDTAVSTNGFYIHAAPWSVGSQGYVNVSHGCINLSTARATTYYAFSIPGDVVTISATGNVADITNGEADWQIPFAQWDNTGTATNATTPSATTSGGQ